MRNSLTVVAAVTVLWAIGASWYYDCKIKRVCGPEATADRTITAALNRTAADVPASAALATQPIEPDTAGESTAGESRSAARVTDAIAVAATPAPPEAGSAATTLTARFGRKSTELILSPEDEAALPALLAAAQQGRQLIVTGHSDSRGSAALKAELALQRAVMLRDWLVSRGVPAAAIAPPQSADDREPVADNRTAEGRALNRRAVVALAP